MDQRRQKQKEHILKWLGAVDSREDYDIHLSRHVSGTSEWLLEDQTVQSWLSTDRSDSFWLSGNPGTGKTHLATHLISSLLYANKRVAYFFCRFDDPTKRGTLDVLKGLSAQLLTQIPLPDDFKAIYETYRANYNQKLEDTEVAVIGLEIILRCLPWRIHVIVDGLDECENPESITEVLNRLCFTPRRGITKWFFTGHPASSIDTLFGKNTARRLDIDTEARAQVDKDIQTLIEQYCWASSDEAKFTLLEKAHGNTLWVSLALRTLDNELMAMRDVEDRMQKIDELQPGLFPMFLRTMKEWAERPAKEMKIARLFLTFVAEAERPLTIEEIDHAMGFGHGPSPKDTSWSEDPNFQSTTLFYQTTIRTGKCALFEISNSQLFGKQIIRLAHQQYKKFLLLDPTKHPFGCEVNFRTRGFFLSAKTNVSQCQTFDFDQRDLGLHCLFYLTRNTRTFGYSISQNVALSDDEFDRLLTTPGLAFLTYAATHWHIHASRWDENMRSQFSAGAMSFMFRNCSEYLLTTRIQAQKAPHLLKDPENLPLPSWLSETFGLEGHLLLYKLFVKEWGYVISTSGSLSRIPLTKEHEKEPIEAKMDIYHPHVRYNSETLVSGVGWLDGPRNIYKHRFGLKEGYQNLPHARVSALHMLDVDSENFTPEVMVLDIDLRTLDLTWSMWQCFLSSGTPSTKLEANKLVNLGVCPWYPRDGTLINKSIVLPEYIEIPTVGSSTLFNVETARMGTKVVVSIVSASQCPGGEVLDPESGDSSSMGGIALGVIDIGTCEKTVDSEIAWFSFDELNLRRTFPDTAIPTFHPTQPLVLWTVSGSEIIVGNYETGEISAVKYSPSPYSDRTSGSQIDDEQEGGQVPYSDDDTDDESSNDLFTTTIALHFLNENELLISTLRSSPENSSLTLTIYDFPSSSTEPIKSFTMAQAPPQIFIWSTPTPQPSTFSSPYSLTFSASDILLTYYTHIDVILLRFPFAELHKPLEERIWQSLVTGISIPASSREPTGLWKCAPKCILLTDEALEDASNQDAIVLGFKSDEGVEESIAYLAIDKDEWVKKKVIEENVVGGIKNGGTFKQAGGGRDDQDSDEDEDEVEEGTVDLSRVFYGEPDELHFEEEKVVIPVRSKLSWNKPTYATCCLRR